MNEGSLLAMLGVYCVSVTAWIVRTTIENRRRPSDTLLGFDLENRAAAERLRLLEEGVRDRLAAVRAAERRVYRPEIFQPGAGQDARGAAAATAEETAVEADRLRDEFRRIEQREERLAAELDERNRSTLAARRRTLAALGRVELITCGLAAALTVWLLVVLVRWSVS
ncbi:hypothetical protein [Marinactinospora rubrisoli]|uniref:Uncharacterized protein n=1 Tax=Marinactinospora rubrisoli TaxID=2715399 RepID=A0ABW2KMX9_9ACTN